MAKTNKIKICKMTIDDVDDVYEIESNLLGSKSKETILKTIDNQHLSYYVLFFERCNFS